MKNINYLLIIGLLLAPSPIWALGGSDSITVEDIDWYHSDVTVNDRPGIGTDRAYEEILQDRASETVLVAVIDSGIDIDHEDLKDHIWVNDDEIAGNNKDDDNNGYIDDMHGWNFLGNSSGENIANEQLELTRLYLRYHDKFKDHDPDKIKKKEAEDYAYYLELKEAYEKELEKTEMLYSNQRQLKFYFNYALNLIKKRMGNDSLSFEEILEVESTDPEVMQAKGLIVDLHEQGVDPKYLEDYMQYLEERKAYHYNLEFRPREIIGDDPTSNNNRYYGNNDVVGSDAMHGTHVAGIIGAIRDNGLGIKGIADNIEIMVLRAVPNGDERDKDIANAIRYAVDNGAQIINMSFGKPYSPEKELVDAAIRYAEEKGVLMVHAAGNDALNIDIEHNYPTPRITNKVIVTNWLTVGASGPYLNEELAADFSNYGKTNVDLFAPGVEIYSTVPGNGYEKKGGTSMAAPVVSGTAALLKSYYPHLTVGEIKEIILRSVTPYTSFEVNKPSEQSLEAPETIEFGNLSQTGGIVNVYEAIKLAEEEYTK